MRTMGDVISVSGAVKIKPTANLQKVKVKAVGYRKT